MGLEIQMCNRSQNNDNMGNSDYHNGPIGEKTGLPHSHPKSKTFKKIAFLSIKSNTIIDDDYG